MDNISTSSASCISWRSTETVVQLNDQLEVDILDDDGGSSFCSNLNINEDGASMYSSSWCSYTGSGGPGSLLSFHQSNDDVISKLPLSMLPGCLETQGYEVEEKVETWLAETRATSRLSGSEDNLIKEFSLVMDEAVRELESTETLNAPEPVTFLKDSSALPQYKCQTKKARRLWWRRCLRKVKGKKVHRSPLSKTDEVVKFEEAPSTSCAVSSQSPSPSSDTATDEETQKGKSNGFFTSSPSCISWRSTETVVQLNGQLEVDILDDDGGSSFCSDLNINKDGASMYSSSWCSYTGSGGPGSQSSFKQNNDDVISELSLSMLPGCLDTQGYETRATSRHSGSKDILTQEFSLVMDEAVGELEPTETLNAPEPVNNLKDRRALPQYKHQTKKGRRRCSRKVQGKKVSKTDEVVKFEEMPSTSCAVSSQSLSPSTDTATDVDTQKGKSKGFFSFLRDIFSKKKIKDSDKEMKRPPLWKRLGFKTSKVSP